MENEITDKRDLIEKIKDILKKKTGNNKYLKDFITSSIND